MPLRRFIYAAVTMILAADAAADPRMPSPHGRWLTEGGKSQIEIYDCAPRLCGRIVWLKEPNTAEGKPKTDSRNPDSAKKVRPIIGLVMLWDFKPVAGERGAWDGGRIYNPEDGETYRSTLTLDGGGTLRVRGYVGAPIFGKTQTWSRVR